MRTQQDHGAEYAKRVNPVRIATNKYVSDNYDRLQNVEPITRNGVTLGAGDGIGQTMSPRVEDLVAMKYLPVGFNGQIPILGPSASLVAKLRREPAGCVAQNCEIPGYMYVSQPILRKPSEPNAVLIGRYRIETGPDALISLNTSPSFLTSGHGVTVPNLVSGSPAGVVGVLVGWGASDYGQYLVVNDSRDPNFRGDLSVRGHIKSETKVSAPFIVGDESVGAGTGSNGADCRLAEMTKDGEFFSRLSSCVNKVVIEPTRASITTFFGNGVQSVAISGEDGTVVINRSSGVEAISMSGNTSEVLLKNSAGVSRLSLSGDAGTVAVGNSTGTRTARLAGDSGQIASSDGITDRFSADNSGNLRVRAAGGIDKAGFDVSDGSGRSFGEVLKANLFATKNTACGPGKQYGDIAQNNQGPGLLMCNGSLWVSISNVSSTLDSWCPTNDELGSNSANQAMICSGNKWVFLTQRFGKRVFVESFSAANNSWIPKPACVSGTAGSIVILTPKNLTTDVVKLNYYATDQGGSWLINIADNLGSASPGEAIAQTYCIYN